MFGVVYSVVVLVVKACSSSLLVHCVQNPLNEVQLGCLICQKPPSPAHARTRHRGTWGGLVDLGLLILLGPSLRVRHHGMAYAQPNSLLFFPWATSYPPNDSLGHGCCLIIVLCSNPQSLGASAGNYLVPLYMVFPYPSIEVSKEGWKDSARPSW